MPTFCHHDADEMLCDWAKRAPFSGASTGMLRPLRLVTTALSRENASTTYAVEWCLAHETCPKRRAKVRIMLPLRSKMAHIERCFVTILRSVGAMLSASPFTREGARTQRGCYADVRRCTVAQQRTRAPRCPSPELRHEHRMGRLWVVLIVAAGR